jgi:hypothetical protein
VLWRTRALQFSGGPSAATGCWHALCDLKSGRRMRKTPPRRVALRGGPPPLRSFACRPEENVLVTDTSIRTRVGAVGIRIDGANRSLSAVRHLRTVHLVHSADQIASRRARSSRLNRWDASQNGAWPTPR